MNSTNCHKLEGPKGFLPTCHEVALRIACGDVDTLSIYKRILLHIHLSMCKACAPFERQLATLAKAFRAKWGGSTDSASIEKLKKKLKKELAP